MTENSDLNFWLYLPAFALWLALAILWLVRVQTYIVVWKTPVPAWASAITTICCVATILTGFRLVFGQIPWATTTVAVLWLAIGICVAIPTFFFRGTEETGLDQQEDR